MLARRMGAESLFVAAAIPALCAALAAFALSRATQRGADAMAPCRPAQQAEATGGERLRIS
jgi:hypothetical protein